MRKITCIRVAALILALILACGIFAGCAGSGNGDGDQTAPSGENTGAATTAGGEATTDDTTPTATSVLGTKDLGGETITFYSRYYNGIWKFRPYGDRGRR